jgi:hypothetical protein
MITLTVEGIDLCKIAGHFISEWLPRCKTNAGSSVKQAICSQLEDRLSLWPASYPYVAFLYA